GLSPDNTEPGNEDGDKQERQRDFGTANQKDRSRSNQKTRDQHPPKARTVNDLSHDQSANRPTDLERRSGEYRSRRGEPGVLGNGGQPVRQEVEVDQVHEIDDPKQDRHLRPSFFEQMDDRRTLRIG